MNGQENPTQEAEKGKTPKGKTDTLQTKKGEDVAGKYSHAAGGNAEGPGAAVGSEAGEIGRRRSRNKGNDDAEKAKVEKARQATKEKFETQIETLRKQQSLV